MKKYFILILSLFSACSNENKKNLQFTGNVEAVEVLISAKVNGEIISINVEEGDKISKGDTLAIIDKTEYELQYQQSVAAERAAEAQYLMLLRGSRKEDIIQGEENLKLAEANLLNAKEDYKRVENLFNTGSVSSKQLDDVRTKYEIAQAQYNSAYQFLQKLKTGAREEEITAAKARYEQASAQTKLLKKKISDCIITSPIDGFVTKRIIEKGELVNYGTPIVRISNLEEIYIMIYVPETKLPLIQLGNSAEVRVDAFPDKRFMGEIIYISPEAEFTPKNIQTKEERVKLVFGVKIKVQNYEHFLKSGIPADVTIVTR